MNLYKGIKAISVFLWVLHPVIIFQINIIEYNFKNIIDTLSYDARKFFKDLKKYFFKQFYSIVFTWS